MMRNATRDRSHDHSKDKGKIQKDSGCDTVEKSEEKVDLDVDIHKEMNINLDASMVHQERELDLGHMHSPHGKHMPHGAHHPHANPCPHEMHHGRHPMLHHDMVAPYMESTPHDMVAPFMEPMGHEMNAPYMGHTMDPSRNMEPPCMQPIMQEMQHPGAMNPSMDYAYPSNAPQPPWDESLLQPQGNPGYMTGADTMEAREHDQKVQLYLQMPKNDLLKHLSACDFVCLDLHLYLNTHPYDKTALAKYNNMIMHADLLRNIYQSRFGSLYSFRSPSNYPWQWVQGAWPWNEQANYLLPGEEG